MTYQFKTKAGVLTIAPHVSKPRLVQLWLGSYLIGTYGSVASAAEVMKNAKTGCSIIDRLHPEDRPTGVSEWAEVEDSVAK
jgi:hypothetical protein